jgi:hypothetical protein
MAESDFSQTLPAFAETSLKAARPGDHFLSERPEKCVPMAGGLSVTFQQIVIHKIGKTLNSCIIKKAASHTPADHPL